MTTMGGHFIILISFLALLVVFKGIQMIPALVFFLKPDSMKYSFDETFSDHDFILKSIPLQQWIAKLQEIGFQPIGVKVEKLPLWGGAYREAAFVSQEAESFASVVLHPNGNPSSLYLYTPLQGGGLVFTRNHTHAPETDGDRISVKNVPSMDFRKILDRHIHQLAAFKGRGLRPAIGSGQLTRMDATGAFYDTVYARRPSAIIRSTGILDFLFFVLLLLGVSIWFALSSR